MIAGILAIFMIFQPIELKINTKLIQKEFVPYYENFYKLAIKHKIPKKNFDKLETVQIMVVPESMELNFLNTHFNGTPSEKNNIIALCVPEENTIFIRESSIIGRTDYSMQELINHELGHCVLGRMHTSLKRPFEDSWIHYSTMYPHISNNYNNEKIKQILEDELFDVTKFDKVEEFLNKVNAIKSADISDDEKFKQINELGKDMTI